MKENVIFLLLASIMVVVIYYWSGKFEVLKTSQALKPKTTNIYAIVKNNVFCRENLQIRALRKLWGTILRSPKASQLVPPCLSLTKCVDFYNDPFLQVFNDTIINDQFFQTPTYVWKQVIVFIAKKIRLGRQNSYAERYKMLRHLKLKPPSLKNALVDNFLNVYNFKVSQAG